MFMLFFCFSNTIYAPFDEKINKVKILILHILQWYLIILLIKRREKIIMDQVTHTNPQNNECCNTNLAIGSVPCQKWSEVYDYSKALTVGTIFKDLHKPFFMGGDGNAR